MHSPLTDIVASGHSTYSAPVPDGCSAIFAPCLDPECQRPCGAHRPYSERAVAITEQMRAERQQASLLDLVIAAFAIWLLIFGAACWGLSRAELAYQIERV